MKKNIITISRPFGTGGHEIGKLLSYTLNIDYYDKELLYIASKESGLSQDFLEANENKSATSFLYSLAMGSHGYQAGQSIEELTLKARTDAILEVAKKGPCVIVGRHADYILNNNDNVLKVFLTAPLNYRIERVAKRDCISLDEAQKITKKMDKRRASYYNLSTNHSWGFAENYDICLNVEKLSNEKIVDIISSML